MLHTFAFDCEFGNAVEKEKISKNVKSWPVLDWSVLMKKSLNVYKVYIKILVLSIINM